MKNELNKTYCNVTIEAIMVYLKLCMSCQKKDPVRKKGLFTIPILHSSFNWHTQINLINMQLQSYSNFRFIMVYQDHLTKFAILSVTI